MLDIPFLEMIQYLLLAFCSFFPQEDPIAEVNDESVDGLAKKVEAFRA